MDNKNNEVLVEVQGPGTKHSAPGAHLTGISNLKTTFASSCPSDDMDMGE